MEDQIGESKLHQIGELFPNKPRHELAAIVKHHKELSIEEIVAMIVSLDNTHKSDECVDVLRIYEIVPDLGLDRIEKVYNDNGKSVDKTLALLTNEVSGSNPAKDQNSMEALCQRLSVKCGKSLSVCSKYLHDSDGDYVRAMIRLVCNKTGGDEECPGQESRVQRGNAKTKTYKYDLNSEEAVEMRELYESDVHLQKIHWEFLKRLLVVERGDLDKVLGVVGDIFEGGCEDLTWGMPMSQQMSQLSMSQLPMSQQLQMSQKISAKKQPEPAVRNFVIPKPTKQNVKKPPKSQSQHLQENWTGECRLDLHQYHVDEALTVIHRVLTDWWQTEKQARINYGKRLFGSQAQYLKPLQIVTGRGIHSKDGVPRLKIQVGKYLRTQGYLYDPESWGFIVTGKAGHL